MMRTLGIFGHRAAGVSTMNPADAYAALSFSNGNLTTATAGPGGPIYQSARSTSFRSSGKLYFEDPINLDSIGQCIVGVMSSSVSLTSYPGGNTNGIGAVFNGAIYTNGSPTGVTGSSFRGGDTVEVAVDLGALLFWFRVNGGPWSGGGDPATGVGGASFAAAVGPFFITQCHSNNTATRMTANFGASAFAHAPPSGYGAWG